MRPSPAVTPTLTTHPDNGRRGFQAAAGALQRFRRGKPCLPFFTSHPGEVTRGFITEKRELLPLRARRKENRPERSDVDFDTRGGVSGRELATRAAAAWGKGKQTNLARGPPEAPTPAAPKLPGDLSSAPSRCPT